MKYLSQSSHDSESMRHKSLTTMKNPHTQGTIKEIYLKKLKKIYTPNYLCLVLWKPI